MNTVDVLNDAFDRIRSIVHDVAERSDPDDLTYRPAPEANTIAWLLWHLSRVQDDHVAELAGKDQVWGEWADRFDLPLAAADTGYGHSPEQVAQVEASGKLLMGYHDAVHNATKPYLAALTPDELERVVDERWDPPVTAGVRIVSVVSDCLQHGGQAAYVLGLAREH